MISLFRCRGITKERNVIAASWRREKTKKFPHNKKKNLIKSIRIKTVDYIQMFNALLKHRRLFAKVPPIKYEFIYGEN